MFKIFELKNNGAASDGKTLKAFFISVPKCHINTFRMGRKVIDPYSYGISNGIGDGWCRRNTGHFTNSLCPKGAIMVAFSAYPPLPSINLPFKINVSSPFIIFFTRKE